MTSGAVVGPTPPTSPPESSTARSRACRSSAEAAVPRPTWASGSSTSWRASRRAPKRVLRRSTPLRQLELGEQLRGHVLVDHHRGPAADAGEKRILLNPVHRLDRRLAAMRASERYLADHWWCLPRPSLIVNAHAFRPAINSRRAQRFTKSRGPFRR